MLAGMRRLRGRVPLLGCAAGLELGLHSSGSDGPALMAAAVSRLHMQAILIFIAANRRET